ncbi:type I-E CRISPR-associated protein Cse1/CasA [Arachnia propionica]|uniref:Type I-E CRISPR-associated protein Cse1/CasA n=1 Tax=Arachnia propionica TaxID=1750 RepID=A0A3P1T2S4_9ACTN|nr:type I-E CRISPR-associated protein Cse1/CasA [Arachnia propionica]RRD03578.1 type I-E CRISPR-associated protein Cse1/CasA [Arachnia propionica]
MSFNLTSEPWIPVLRDDGTSDRVSLRECFAEADQIRRLSAELPTQSFAVLRMLLAIIHDAIGIHWESDLEDMHETGLDLSRVDAYLNEYEDRFDLFHPTRPFMQVATLRTAKNEASGLEKLISDVPNGDPFLTTRAGTGLARVDAAEAALWLIHCHAFDPSGIRSGAVGDPEVKGGKGYPIGPGWSGQIGGVILHGRHLAETLLFNLVPTPESLDDRPVWARDDVQTERRELEAQPRGPVDLLAWQSRRIRLVGDAENGVTGVVLCQGDKVTPQNRQGLEAMTAWRYSRPQSQKFKQAVYMPLKHDPTRSAWRGAPAVLSRAAAPVDGHEATLQPTTTRMLKGLDPLGSKDLSATLELVGMEYGPQEATVAELYHDTLDFRVSLLGEKAAPVVTMIHDALVTTDQAVWELGRLARNLDLAAGGDEKSGVGATQRTQLAAWSALDVPAREWLAALTAATDTVEAHRAWQQEVHRALSSEARKLLTTCSPAAVVGRQTRHGFMTAGLAESYFHAALRKQLPLLEQPTQRGEEE